MQKKESWEQNLKQQARKEIYKKMTVWGGILLLCIVGLAGLVMFAGKSTSTNQTPVELSTLPAPKSTDIIVGDKNAKVVITEYADFQCPACAANNPITNRVLEEYKGKVKLVYRFFPLRGIHKNALISAQAAYASWRLGKFEEMKDMLYENQSSWENLGDPSETFVNYAKDLGLNENEFKALMTSDEAKKAVESGEKESLGLGLNSTPSFFIGNKRFQLQGFDGFKKVIDEELSRQ
ncbi:thioredoxin domain-containing protein [Candidatus Roizmanbacteria bacterium]|nr:thioredoxin domain-containing protein [Candidatus Roizmanbacteria bacterium]